MRPLSLAIKNFRSTKEDVRGRELKRRAESEQGRQKTTLREEDGSWM